MPDTYRATLLTRKGGPDVLSLVDLPLAPPGPGEVRVRVRATGVGSTDVTMRRGSYPYAPRLPFVPGYETVGVVEALGEGVEGLAIGDRVAALLVHGGYAEVVTRPASAWIRVPEGPSDAEVAAVILNHVTAWQAIHRTARLAPGGTALVTAAAGGVGQALVELLRLNGTEVVAAAAPRSHALLAGLGATPIEGRTGAVDGPTLAHVPGGVDAAFDGVGGAKLRECIRATRRGGSVVWYGFMGASSFAAVARNVLDLGLARLRGRRARFYGITALYRKDPGPFREDLPKVLELLRVGAIRPRLAHVLPLDDARRANELLEAGGVDGKIVLVA